MDINKIETKSHPKDVFDDDFEVIYEGDLPELPNDLGSDDYKDVLSNLSELDTTNSLGINYLEQNRTRTLSHFNHCKTALRQYPNGQKSKKTYHIADLLLQIATLLLIVVITGFLAVSFWKHNTSYADVTAAVAGHKYILGAYYGMSLFILLTEWISFLNVLLGGRSGKWHGMFSFLIIYRGALLSGQFAHLIPSDPFPLQGIREALKIYGALNQVLLPLCASGIVICIIRKIRSKK